MMRFSGVRGLRMVVFRQLAGCALFSPPVAAFLEHENGEERGHSATFSTAYNEQSTCIAKLRASVTRWNMKEKHENRLL